MIALLQSLLTGPGVMLLILAVLALEAVALTLLSRGRRARGAPPLALAGILANLGAGAALVAAMLVIVSGGHWRWIGVWLTVAFAAHLVDLATRLASPR